MNQFILRGLGSMKALLKHLKPNTHFTKQRQPSVKDRKNSVIGLVDNSIYHSASNI